MSDESLIAQQFLKDHMLLNDDIPHDMSIAQELI